MTSLELSTATLNYNFAQNGDVLQRGYWAKFGRGRYTGVHYSAALHIRATKQFAIEIGVQRIQMDLEVYDRPFSERNALHNQVAHGLYRGMTSTYANYDADKIYSGGYLQAYYFLRPLFQCQPYFSVGLSQNFLDSRTTFERGSFDYNPTNEHTRFTANYPTKYFNKFIETGLSWGNGPNHGPINLSLGVKLSMAGQILSGDYSNTGGATEYTDHVTASGSYLSFCIKLGYTLGNTNPSKSKSDPAVIPRNIQRFEH